MKFDVRNFLRTAASVQLGEMQGDIAAEAELRQRQAAELNQALSIWSTGNAHASEERARRLAYHNQVFDFGKNVDPSQAPGLYSTAFKNFSKLSGEQPGVGFNSIIQNYGSQYAPAAGIKPPPARGSGWPPADPAAVPATASPGLLAADRGVAPSPDPAAGAPVPAPGTALAPPGSPPFAPGSDTLDAQRKLLESGAGLLPFGLGKMMLSGLDTASILQQPEVPQAMAEPVVPPKGPPTEVPPEVAETIPEVEIPGYGRYRIGGVDEKQRRQILGDLDERLKRFTDFRGLTPLEEQRLRAFIGQTKNFRQLKTPADVYAAQLWLTEADSLQLASSLASSRDQRAEVKEREKRHTANLETLYKMSPRQAALALPELLRSETDLLTEGGKDAGVLPRLAPYTEQIKQIQALFDPRGKTGEQITADRAKAERMAGGVKRQFASGLTPHQVEQKILGLEKELTDAWKMSPGMVSALVKELKYWGDRAGREISVDAASLLKMPQSELRKLGQVDDKIKLEGDRIDLARSRYNLDRDKFEWEKDHPKGGAKGKGGVTGNKQMAPFEENYKGDFKAFNDWEKKFPIFAGALRAEGKPNNPANIAALQNTPMYAQGKLLLERLNRSREAWYQAYERLGLDTQGLPRQNPKNPAGQPVYPGQPGYQAPQININVTPGGITTNQQIQAPGAAGGGRPTAGKGGGGGAATGKSVEDQGIKILMDSYGISEGEARKLWREEAQKLRQGAKGGGGTPKPAPKPRGKPAPAIPKTWPKPSGRPRVNPHQHQYTP